MGEPGKEELELGTEGLARCDLHFLYPSYSDAWTIDDFSVSYIKCCLYHFVVKCLTTHPTYQLAPLPQTGGSDRSEEAE